MYKICIRYDLQPSRKEIREAMAEAMGKEMLQRYERKLRSVLCPEHKLPAKVSLVRGALQVAVCCKKLEAAVREELKPA